ncbi:MAG: mechanosensitive ion channel [Gammaproteobacteria bacterium]|nr:mechanosensitive ion channel [Gammaproteobacteria bacterium]
MGYLLTATQISITILALVLLTRFANQRLVKHFDGKPHLAFRRQLIQLGGIVLAVLLLILFLPLDTALRGQLLSLFGLIVSATIALSSTTLVGNVMAGIMLKTVGSCRPGNYITVGDHFGRITTMDLLHTELQTEERDLTTLPNMYLVTNPIRVMRTSGTLLSVELSLGYDVSRHQIESLLLQAASETGLESPFVQIRELGDFSVTYQISGLLKEVNRIIDKRRELRARTMDNLHAAGIEIVSPSFMNTRAFESAEQFIPENEDVTTMPESERSTDKLIFDIAEEAESVSRLREMLSEVQDRIKVCQELADDKTNEAASEAATREIETHEKKAERLQSLIDRREANIAKE